MLETKLNRPKLFKDLLIRPHLIEKLERSSLLPVILISAPTGYGKSLLISQWLEQHGNDYCWLSLDESMNESSTFITYFAKMLEIASSAEMPRMKNLDKEYYLLTWETIISLIINRINELKEPIRLILDDYHLIKNQEIHQLISAIINENISHFHLVIIARRDPPLQLRELRLYQKMLEIRQRDLRFDENEVNALLGMKPTKSFNEDEIKELMARTEGWILGIRMILMARSLTEQDDETVPIDYLTNDMDNLIDHIAHNFSPEFFRRVQLCALCDQFNSELIDSIFSFFFNESGSADKFFSELSELNLFLVPTVKEGTWYRFHHLFGDILKRQLKRTEPDIITSLYLHISSWYAERGLIDEAIHYMVMAQEYDMAVDLIVEHTTSKFEVGEWWVVKRWLENIPEEIRMSNVDLLLIELYFCQETYEVKEFSFLLETLEALGVKNSSTKNQSLYLYHLGYYLAYIRPNPEKALECLEQSKSLLHDETAMFGGRRELITANTRQMLGKTALALKLLDEHDKNFQYASVMHMRSLHARIYVHLLSGNFKEAVFESEKFHFIAKKGELKILRAWSLYLNGNSAFQTANLEYASQFLREVISYDKVFNYRVYFDALAGLVLLYSLEGDTKAAESLIITMEQMTSKFKNSKFQSYTRSVKARVNLHKGLGGMELEWAQMNWDKQTQEPYLFLMDVPSLTKISIIVSHGTTLQVEEALHLLAEVKAHLDSVHNRYHDVDVELLKAMALHRLGKQEQVQTSLGKALLLAEGKGVKRPVLEAYQVMPTLFHQAEISSESRRILVRLGLEIAPVKTLVQSALSKEQLTVREQEIVTLISNGLRNKEIADLLNISTVTVKSHLTNIYRKLDVPNRISMLNKFRNLSPS